SEQSPPDHSSRLFGAQLWIALPEQHRDTTPAFEFHDALPHHEHEAGSITVLAGEIDGAVSPMTTCSPLVGASVTLTGTGTLPVPLQPEFEHAVLAQSTGVTVAGIAVPVGAMLYLGRGRHEIEL